MINSSSSNILSRLASGEISAEEAARQLREPARPRLEPAPAALASRWLHIRVTSLETGRQKVNVNLPLTWVHAGMQIGARFEPRIESIDLADLLEQIQAGAQGKLVEVEDLEDGERVEIYVD